MMILLYLNLSILVAFIDVFKDLGKMSGLNKLFLGFAPAGGNVAEHVGLERSIRSNSYRV
jgi:hypothetical protein